MSTANPYASPEANTIDANEETYQPKIFSVNGRIGRIRYLAYSFITSLVIVFAVGIIMGIMFAVMGTGSDAENNPMVFLLVGIMYIPLFAIYFIMAKRRLNDLDKSGWLSLLNLVPIINFFFALYLVFFPGTNGPNNYGPKPIKNPPALIVLILLFLFMSIGFFAAVAIPAYQEFASQAQMNMQQMQDFDQ